MAAKPRLFLIDGHALAYRSYFALTRGGDSSRWMTRSGEPTAGTYGFTSVLLSLLEQEEPEYLAVSFDVGKTFRDDLYPDYKATREKMPDDLRLQIERIREVVASFGIPVLEAEGYEADDVLGTVSQLASKEGVKTIILTGDRDLLQLATKDVVIRLSGQKLSEAVDYGPKEVEAKYGLKPEQLIDHKALVGDKSDNIPGVAGVGEKTAAKLLSQYGDLESIYENLEQVAARFRTKLEAAKDEAELSQKLGTIVTDVPIEFDLEACKTGEYDRARVVELFRELEFRALLKRISDEDRQITLFVSGAEETAIAKTHIIDTPDALAKLQKKLAKASVIAFDVETTSTDVMRAELVGVSLAIKPEQGYYLPTGHVPALSGGEQLDQSVVLDALRSSFTDPKIPKVGHNLKYDFTMLARLGLRASPLSFDTMLAEWLINPSSRSLGLKNLSWVRLGVEMTEIEKLIGTGTKQKLMSEVPIAEVAPYAVADAAVCLQLQKELEKELRERGQSSLFQDVEMPLIEILADMEMTGIALDTKFLEGLSNELAERLGQIETDIYDRVGHSFNVNSPQQLSKVLFEELGIIPPDGTRKTAAGNYSTAASVLEALSDEQEIVGRILEQRELSKLKSTYADALPAQLNPDTGRVHTSYSQTGSVTGRLASSNPNLQNIPIRTELGREIRRAFIAEKGSTLLGVDYSQIELRVVSHIAEDKTMMDAFHQDEDIHSTTAAAVFGGKMTSEMRRRAKAVNFGLIYGMSPFGLTRTTDLTLAEAEDFVKVYFEKFPGVRKYLDDVREQAGDTGFVETLLGRRRYFPVLMADAKPSPQHIRARAEREAVNSPIQGSAADIIKLAMIKLPDALTKAGLAAKMLLQVHDELVFEVPEKELKKTQKVVQEVMQEAYDLKVPLKTDAKAGPNWAAMSPLG